MTLVQRPDHTPGTSMPTREQHINSDYWPEISRRSNRPCHRAHASSLAQRRECVDAGRCHLPVGEQPKDARCSAFPNVSQTPHPARAARGHRFVHLKSSTTPPSSGNSSEPRHSSKKILTESVSGRAKLPHRGPSPSSSRQMIGSVFTARWSAPRNLAACRPSALARTISRPPPELRVEHRPRLRRCRPAHACTRRPSRALVSTIATAYCATSE